MSESQPTGDKPGATEEQGGVPQWVKTTGAIIGILATAAGIVVGVFSLVKEFQETSREIAHERRQEAAEEARAQKELAEQMRLQNEAEQQRAAQQIEELRLENEAKKQEQDAKFAEEAQQTRQAELQLEILERQELQTERVAEREQRIAEQKILLEAIAKLAGPEEHSSLNHLLTISRYIDKSESQGMIVRALVAYAVRTCSSSELDLIFSMLRSVADDAFPEVVKLNRVGYRQLREQLKDHFKMLVWQQIAGITRNEETYELYACKAIDATIRASDTIRPSLQRVLLHDHWHGAAEEIVEVGLQTTGVDVTGLTDSMRCSAELLNGTSEFLKDHLSSYAARSRIFDLSDVYIDIDIPLDRHTKMMIDSTRGSFIGFRDGTLAGEPDPEKIAFWKRHCGGTGADDRQSRR